MTRKGTGYLREERKQRAESVKLALGLMLVEREEDRRRVWRGFVEVLISAEPFSRSSR
jgi:hypothetical protein